MKVLGHMLNHWMETRQRGTEDSLRNTTPTPSRHYEGHLVLENVSRRGAPETLH